METILEFLIGFIFVLPTAAMLAADLIMEFGPRGFWDELGNLHGN